MHVSKGAQAGERRIRRAAAACYRCHWRKVRCDAAVLGYPCTNCTLDGITDCTLRPNATVRYKRLQRKDSDNATTPKPPPDSTERITLAPTSQYEDTSRTSDGLPATRGPDVPMLEMSTSGPTADLYSENSTSRMPGSSGFTFPGQYFLNLDRISSLPMSDVHVLMVNGCLEIPPKPALDVFLTKYFLLLHPLVPILDEAQFWHNYIQSNESLRFPQKVSLFVFHAMLLASCPFVPIEIIHQCKFRDVHDARRVLYNRAKILYDTGFENDPLARAQGSLLLTFHTTAEDPQATMTWNICAIQNTITICTDTNLPECDSMRITKKRLWWSVFVRDRLLWLGRHRRPQFISANFNMPARYLDEQDITDEIMSSTVYTPDSKRLLLKIFQAQCQLAVILTDVNAISFSVSDGYFFNISAEELNTSLGQVARLKCRLAQWRDDLQGSLHHTDIPRQEAIETITNLLWMHYQSARMALAHHETFLVENNPQLVRDKSGPILLSIARELKDSVFHITQKMAYFASQNLAESIPLSVLASCGTPMVLSAIDVKLSSSYSETLDRRRALDSCSQVIKQSGKVYDVTDFFSQGTNHILTLAYTITKNLFLNDNVGHQKKSPAGPTGNSRNLEGQDMVPAFNGLRIKGWVEAFLKYPRAYLVISTCIDHSLASGRLPKMELLPPLLQGTLSVFLGLPKLPWTLPDPRTSNEPFHRDEVVGRKARVNEIDSSVLSPDEGNPSVDDNPYLSLMHTIKNDLQCTSHDYMERGSVGGNPHHNETPSYSQQLHAEYANTNLQLNFHLFDPLCGKS